MFVNFKSDFSTRIRIIVYFVLPSIECTNSVVGPLWGSIGSQAYMTDFARYPQKDLL